MQRSPKPWYEGVMLGAIVSTVLALLSPVSDADADALRSTAPTYLTLDTAREHLHAARVASTVTGVDESLLLSVSWHESRYDHKAISNEPGGKISCGALTPVPMHPAVAKKVCAAHTASPLAGYLAGARHLRTWMNATGNLRVALLGFAGGYVGIKYCSDPANRKDYRCWTPEVFQHRARMIRQAMKRSRVFSA